MESDKLKRLSSSSSKPKYNKSIIPIDSFKDMSMLPSINLILSIKKDVQLESCELSFIWSKMRTAARKAASQIALRDCSKVAVGESQYIRFW